MCRDYARVTGNENRGHKMNNNNKKGSVTDEHNGTKQHLDSVILFPLLCDYHDL